MIADLGTRKGVKIEDILWDSDWVKGKAWMSWNEADFRIKTWK